MTVSQVAEPATGGAPPPRRARRARPVVTGSAVAWTTFAGALSCVVLIPVLMFVSRAFEDGGSAFGRMLDTPRIGEVFLTTVLLAGGSTLIAAIFAIILAALIQRVPARLRGLAAFLPQLPLVIPAVAVVYGWIFVLDPRVGYLNTLLRATPFFDSSADGPLNVYSHLGILLVTATEFTAIVFAFVYARMLEISGSVEAAARISGASAARTFATVTLPLLRPSLVAGLVVAFLLGLGQFTAPLFLGTRENIQVITTEIFQVRQQFPVDYPLTAALGLPLLVFGILAITIQRAVIGDQRRYMTQTSGRGMAKTNSWMASIVVFGYGFVVVVVPVAAITLVAFSRFWNGSFGDIQFTTANVTGALGDPVVHDAILNTLLASFLAAAIALPIGFAAALALSGVVPAPSFIRHALDYIFIAPLAIPRAVLGMVVLFVFIRPPFSLYGTLALFVIGYVFIIIPFSLRSQYSSLIGVHSSLFEAARVCGSGQFGMVCKIALPIARRGMAAAFTLGIILLTSDFAVSIMVQSPGKQVMGTLLFEIEQTGSAPQVATMALIMTAVTAIILAITARLGGRASLENL